MVFDFPSTDHNPMTIAGTISRNLIFSEIRICIWKIAISDNSNKFLNDDNIIEWIIKEVTLTKELRLVWSTIRKFLIFNIWYH
jgi:hypothetical protein